MARILIVEDNPMNMELASDLLELDGHDVLQAEAAQEGLDLASAEKPELILMDVQLPGMDGLTATQRLRERDDTKDIPVVAMTAHAMEGDDKKAYRAGCMGYITKPIDTAQFRQQVTDFLQT